MFIFGLKNKLLNLILSEYTKQIHVYTKNLKASFDSLSEDATEEQINKANYKATQKYYETVFDGICNELSKNISNFKLLLPLKIASASSCGYEFDPDNLAAASVFAFTYWALTNKKAPSDKCIYINHMVNELKNDALHTLENY